MGSRLFVGNLSYQITEAELRDIFAENGRTVVDAKIVLDRDTGRPRGFAFIEMSNENEAAEVQKAFDGREVQGRTINVSEARARSPRPPGERSYGGGAGYGGGGSYGGGGYGESQGGRGQDEGRRRRGDW
jgi:RNA recognition motif-containing protein